MLSDKGFPRVAMYSHDTYGLGHLTRTVRIARGVREAFPEASVLILSGSPIAHRFSFPSGVEYVKLPSVVKAGPEAYVSRELKISFRSIRKLRAAIIRDTVQLFRPHLLLVDNVPLGMKRELKPTLDWLHEKRPEVQIHLNLRDVLDDPPALLAVWEKVGVPRYLREVFGAIHVFGSRSVHDAVEAYDLPRGKTEHLGYISPAPAGSIVSKIMPPVDSRRRSVLVTVGGGGDGHEILWNVLRLQESLGEGSPYHFHIVTGPLMDRDTLRGFTERASGIPGVTLDEYVEHLPTWMGRCDLVLSMGGYNTLCEVLASARRSVVVPRVHPRLEQWIRARALEERGLLRVIHPGALNPGSLDEALRSSLATGPTLYPVRCPPLNGIERFKRRLRESLGTGEIRMGAPRRRRRQRAKALLERSHTI